MKALKLLIPVIAFSLPLFSQQVTLLSTLENTVQESSGLIYLDGKIITHNDSGDDPVLYEIDSLTGNVVRTVTVNNASHVDWEDICNDDTYIYIGDFGNNSGSRTDLKIYRISISDYTNTETNEVSAETINFSYPDQTDFTTGQNSTNFDAEALISLSDSLYIFSKRWLDKKSVVYSLPSKPGSYTANKLATLNSDGLITGATYNTASENVMLIGYNFTTPFIISVKDFDGSVLASGTTDRKPINLPTGISIQVEAITVMNSNEYYFTSEQSFFGSSGLLRLVMEELSGITGITDLSGSIYPNPVSRFFRIMHEDFHKAEIYSEKGVLIRSEKEALISVNGISSGVYVMVLRNSKSQILGSGKLIVGEGESVIIDW